MKRWWVPVSVFSALLVLTVAIAMATAGEEKKDQKSGKKSEVKKVEKMSGKALYKNYCKICHLPDSPNGEYTPMTLIQDQWDRFYKEKYVKSHTEVVDSLHGGEPVLELINKDMLKKIKKFTIDGAADSEHPMTCG